MIFLEVLVILAVVALQSLVFLQNRRKAAQLSSLFPEREDLFMETASATQAPASPDPIRSVLAGQAYKLADEPGKRFSISGRDGEFWVVQEEDTGMEEKSSFLLTQKEVEALPQKRGFVLIEEQTLHPNPTVQPMKVPAARNPSEAFAQHLAEVRAFLQQNQGTLSDLESIKDMSRRRLEWQQADLQATVATPLYIGLLGTFLGVIIGLLAIVTDGVTEEAIGSFLLGVVVAMTGSFFGLLFTLLGNHESRKAGVQAAERFGGWLNFLQISLLPGLQSDLSQGLSNLRLVLDEFNQDFFKRIADFKTVFSNLNQYVAQQERFITALQQSDYSQLTESNLRFFEQIQKNETLFERFGQYLQRLNESMEMGREASADIREIVTQLRQLDDVQGYLRKNEELIRKQLGYLAAHQDKMEAISQGIQQHFIEAGDEIGSLVRRRLQIMQKEEQDAGEQLRVHFERLRQENVYQKLADQLQPIRQMENDVQSMRELFADTLKHLLETQQYLIRKINQDGQTQGRVLKEMELLNNHMQQLSERKSWLQRMLGN